MSQYNFMDKIRLFFGLPTEPPRNDFRNPIWGSDDDDDGDELYTRQQMETFTDPQELHREFLQQMQDMFRNFGNLFGEMGTFLNEENIHSFRTLTDIPESDVQSENFDSNRIRQYYLKPGYHKQKFGHPKEDVTLDGKIGSNEISDMLKLKEGGQTPQSSFHGEIVPGRSFSKTIITTSVTKPDGSIETRRIIKNGNEVVEETITSTEPSKGPYNPSFGPVNTNHFLSQLSSFFWNLH